MPLRKYKYIRRRKYRRRRRFRKRASTKLSQMVRYPVPMKMKRTLRYMDTSFALNPSIGGTPADYVFSANGLYDPNITGIGHQPIGFDQLMTMYNHYTVIGAKITLTVKNQDTSSLQWVGVAVTASPATLTNIQEVVENGYCKMVAVDTLGTDGGFKQITVPVSIGKFMGRKHILSEDDFRGGLSTNPPEQVYFHCVAAPNSTQDTSQISCHAIIDYITVFTEPKQLPQS